MAASRMRMRAWDPRILSEVIGSSGAEAVVVTDKNGRIVFSELRREAPAELAEIAELAFAVAGNTGQRLGLGGAQVVASVHERGMLVCGGDDAHTAVVLASEGANLGQLLHAMRRVFPHGAV
jgi:predicted regulator of Ras-like GTPase activity (Roadblock/LC7/MglB family)